jgi:hypothetical protein
MNALSLRAERAAIVRELRILATSTKPSDAALWKELDEKQERLRQQIQELETVRPEMEILNGPIADQDTADPLPYTAELPCLLRGSFYRFAKCDPSFYAIGKIAKNGWREALDIAMPDAWKEYLSASPVPTHFGLAYTGPFFIRCDHGCSHGNDSHATASICSGSDFRPGSVFRRSERQIQEAGFVFVWIGVGKDALDTAYGSLVEIGIAHTLGKPILLAHHPRANVRDFWFAIETASAVVCAESPLSALGMPHSDRSRR